MKEEYEFPRIESNGRMGALLLLAALLVGVFFLSLGAYSYYEAIGEGSLTGELPDAVLALRHFMETNEAVSVFLGLSTEGALETAGRADGQEIHRAAAEAYIREHQR